MYLTKTTAEYLSGKRVIHKSGDVEFHNHESALGGYDFEIVYVISGKGIHVIEGERTRIEAGNYIFIDYGISHTYEIEKDDELELINLVFDHRAADLWYKILESLAELAAFYGINSKVDDKSVRTDYIFKDDKNLSVKAMFLDIIRELTSRLPGYHEAVKCKLKEILIQGFRQYFNTDATIECSPTIRFIVDYLNNFYMENTTLSEHAEKLCLSLPYLSKKFKEEVGATYTEYLQRRRITESCRILSTSDDSIESIAEYVGYSDSKKYREKFKEYVGISPREYRKAMRDQR